METWSVSHPLCNVVEDLWWSGGVSGNLESSRFVYAKTRWITGTYNVVLEGSEDCCSQQDSSPCSTARSVKVRVKDNQLKTLSWPAQSADLNATDNLWSVIKRKVDGHKGLDKSQPLENQYHCTKYWFLTCFLCIIWDLKTCFCYFCQCSPNTFFKWQHLMFNLGKKLSVVDRVYRNFYTNTYIWIVGLLEKVIIM